MPHPNHQKILNKITFEIIAIKMTPFTASRRNKATGDSKLTRITLSKIVCISGNEKALVETNFNAPCAINNKNNET